MLDLLIVVATSAISACRTQRELALENLALRHQLAVLQRKRGTKRLRLGRLDRALWSWLRGVWTGWAGAVVIVRPATVIRWHRDLFRWFWARKSGASRAAGRPTIAADVIELIRTMANANRLWGAPRIHGELGRLGIGWQRAP